MSPDMGKRREARGEGSGATPLICPPGTTRVPEHCRRRPRSRVTSARRTSAKTQLQRKAAAREQLLRFLDASRDAERRLIDERDALNRRRDADSRKGALTRSEAYARAFEVAMTDAAMVAAQVPLVMANIVAGMRSYERRVPDVHDRYDRVLRELASRPRTKKLLQNVAGLTSPLFKRAVFMILLNLGD